MSGRRSSEGEQLPLPHVDDTPKPPVPGETDIGAGIDPERAVTRAAATETSGVPRLAEDEKVCETCSGSGCPQCGFRSPTPWPKAKRITPRP